MYAGTGLQEEQAMGQADGDKQRGSRFTAKEQQSWQERQNHGLAAPPCAFLGDSVLTVAVLF